MMSNTTQAPAKTFEGDPIIIVILQTFLPLSFTVAMAGIIAWIWSLIILSRELDDTPSVSMGISIVAIPVFLALLFVFWYVFISIIWNQEEDDENGAPAQESEQEGGVS